MDKSMPFAKQAMQWVLAVALVFSGLLIWNFGVAPTFADCNANNCNNADCCSCS
jgi:hypothetical protein